MAATPLNITLRYFALLREERGLAEENIKTTIRTAGDLYVNLATGYNFSLASNQIRVSINNHFKNLETTLKDGDTVVFVPPIAGG